MDLQQRIQLAIEYIEDNLHGQLNNDKVAQAAFLSSFHFQRVFHAKVGCTLAEYIRSRKLTLAAVELASGTGNTNPYKRLPIQQEIKIV